MRVYSRIAHTVAVTVIESTDPRPPGMTPEPELLLRRLLQSRAMTRGITLPLSNNERLVEYTREYDDRDAAEDCRAAFESLIRNSLRGAA